MAYEFHRFIIGAKGVGVRQLMDDHNVNVKVPSSDAQSNIIVITGTKDNVADAREALMERVEELEKVRRGN